MVEGNSIHLCSAGFKYGHPNGNYVFDVSFLPNPYNNKKLRELSYSSPKLKSFFLKQEVTKEFITEVIKIIKLMDKVYYRRKIVFVFACSGGQYRSPTIVDIICDYMKEYEKEMFERTYIEHRDLAWLGK